MKLQRNLNTIGRFLGSQFRENSALLLYHRVADATPADDPFRLCVSPANFESQLEMLREIGDPLSIGDFTTRHANGTLTKNSICLTFDDGFLDLKESALPLLEKYEIPAAVYVVSGNLGETPWWDTLYALLGADELPLEIDIGGEVFLTKGESQLSIFNQLYQALRDDPLETQRKRVDIIFAQLGERPTDLPRLMNPDELREFAAHPLITIGGHTETHRPLMPQPAEEQLHEIVTSLQTLSEITEGPVTSFSYPFGLRGRDYDDSTIAMVKKAGLRHALAADKGTVHRDSDPYSLPRLWVHNQPGSQLKRTLRWWC